MTQSTWFYTREGERLGPVDFAELRAKAAEASLNPRLDMVWKQGMDAWKPAGEVEGLYERPPEPEPKESLAPPAGPYTPPKVESAADVMGKEGGWPGARRRSFLIATFLFPLLLGGAFVGGSEFLTKQFGPQIMGMAALGVNLAAVVVGLYFGLQRLANVGMSRWWYLGNFVPFLNLWIGYRSFACPAGYAYHKKLDGAGIALAIFYWLMILIGVLAIAAVIAVLSGAVGDPALKEQILRGDRTMLTKPAADRDPVFQAGGRAARGRADGVLVPARGGRHGGGLAELRETPGSGQNGFPRG